jgi:hypothetical protein
MATNKKPAEAVQGRYTALPHALLDSTAFMGASHMARSLLYELMRQHDGKNNGHLHLSTRWLKSRGWNSANSVQRAKVELLTRGLAVKTREGGLNNGADRYALTWLGITNFVGLDIESKNYHPGAYQLLGPFVQPTAKRLPGEPPPVIRTSPARVPPSKCHSSHGNSAVPPMGTVNSRAVPPMGTRAGIFGTSTAPPMGNNVLLPLYPPGRGGSVVDLGADLPKRTAGKPRKRIVGKVGKSGKPGNSHATALETAHPTQHINASAYASLRASALGAGMTWATRCGVNPVWGEA